MDAPAVIPTAIVREIETRSYRVRVDPDRRPKLGDTLTSADYLIERWVQDEGWVRMTGVTRFAFYVSVDEVLPNIGIEFVDIDDGTAR